MMMKVDCIGELPECRSYHSACSCGGKLYVFGGCGVEGRLKDLWVFTPETKAWKRLPDPPGIAGRGGPTLERIEETQTLILFAGFVGEETKDFLTYDIGSEEWTVHQPPAAIEPRSVCQSFTLGSVTVCYGGEIAPSERGHEGAGGFSSEILAISSEEIKQIGAVGGSQQPPPRGWGAACTLSSKSGVIFGGLTGTDENPTRLDDVWVLTLEEEE